jgi:copper oxidase (laccase) domain-containing protein
MRLQPRGMRDTSLIGGSARVIQASGRGNPRHRRLYLDVAGANRDQLRLAGVPEASIHIAASAPAMHLDILTSYRAEKEKAVRIAGAIRCRV